MVIPYKFNPLGVSKSSYFELVVKPGILGDSLTYGFTPYWNANGYCKVIDWGDNTSEDAVTSGTVLTHTYSSSGTYKIKIKADCYRMIFGAMIDNDYVKLVYNSNGNWDALGNITDSRYMFNYCINAVFQFKNIPRNIVNGSSMFGYCKNAILPLTSLPSSLTNSSSMFENCFVATLPLTSLPSNLTNGSSMFSYCKNAILPLTSLPSSLTNSIGMFSNCTSASLSITSLPSNLTAGNNMFSNCTNATLLITSLPSNLTNGSNMFYGCNKAVIDLDTLVANAPANGWEKLTNIMYMFYNAGAGNSPGTVTGSRSAFLAKCPKVKITSDAFTGTNTTE